MEYVAITMDVAKGHMESLIQNKVEIPNEMKFKMLK